MNVTKASSRFARCAWALFLPILLISLIPAASAQCSQATRPELSEPDHAATSAQNSPSAAATEPAAPATRESSSSSSSQAEGNDLRFVTDKAVTVLEETPLQVMNDMPISSRTTRPGAKISFTLTRDVIVDGILVIPCGATVYGTVVSSKQAGRLTGASNLTLQLTALNLDGRSYPLYTPPFKVVGESKTAPTMNKIATGAAVGSLAMDARTAQLNPRLTAPVTGGERVLADSVAAGVGAGVGTAIAASSPPSIALIPAESQMEFTLAAPIAVYPVDQITAIRLAQGMHDGGPALYVRGETQ